MNLRVRVELSVMMFLQFFIWGAWAVTMGSYLGEIGFTGREVARAYSTTAWAAIVSPFFIGMIADRFFSAQRVLALMHVMGAVLMYLATRTTDPYMFFWLLLGYALCYMPTLALTNAIAFNQMKQPDKEFPPIRVLGTLGWIVAGLAISKFDAEKTVTPLLMAAGCSLAMGLYSLFLPDTPPQSRGTKVSIGDIIGLPALKLMKKPSFTIFVLGSLLVCIPLAFYYAFTNPFLNESGVTGTAAKQSMGQMSEVFFMLVMPFFFARLGVKKMLLAGMGAWVLRYVLFAFGNSDSLVFMFYGGILLHGICYDFFFVTGQIYVDNEAPVEVRASAQGFLGLVTYGVGMVIGNWIAGVVTDHYSATAMVDGIEKITHQWQTIWMIPAGMAAVVFILFALFFREEAAKKAA